MKNILHLSDLHLSVNKKYGFFEEDADSLVSDLLNDINDLKSESGVEIDSIFFTGDIAFSGKGEEYQAFRDKILDILVNELSLNKEDVFLVPGNHDCDRAVIPRVEKSYRATAEDSDLSSLYDDIEKGEEKWSRQDSYFKFKENYLSGVDGIGRLHDVRKVSNNLYIICANSSWLAQDDYDKGLLRLSKKQLELILRKLPKRSKKILLTHHPINWIYEDDKDEFSKFIEKNISIHCFGHMHEFRQRSESEFNDGITVSLQAGTLDTRSELAGYSVIVLNDVNDLSDGKVLYRKYCGGGGFEAWSERVDNGEFEFTTENRSTFDGRKFSKLSSEKIYLLDEGLIFNIGISDGSMKSLRSMYIEPNFEKPSFFGVSSSTDSKISKAKHIEYYERSVIVFGGKNSGKTFLLKYLYSNALEKQVEGDFSNFCFYLDFDALNIVNKNSIINFACQNYSTADLKTSFENKVKDMISRGKATFYIDGFSANNKKKFEYVLDFIKLNKDCRYVFSADIDEGSVIHPLVSDCFDLEVNSVSIGMLKRGDVRKIVEKWVPTLPIQCEHNVYDEVTKLINNSKLPHNYFVYTMLLSIYESQRDVNGIMSEADVVENFIEILLRKNYMDTPSDKPQYRVLLHFMGFVSSRVFYSKDDGIVYNDLLHAGLSFNALSLHNYRVDDYITPLIVSGILNRKGDYIYFSQIAFYHYFLSYYMAHDGDLKNDVLSDSSYLKFDKVVEYFASKHLSDFSLLDYMSNKIKENICEIDKDVLSEKGVRVDDIDFENLKDLSILDVASTIEDVEAKVLEIEADRERDDARLDEISPLNSNSLSSSKSDVDISENEGLDYKLRSQLSLYSRIFRNTELVMQPEQTLKVFEDIVLSYIYMTKLHIVQLDEKVIIPLLKPIIDEHIVDHNYSEEDKDKVMHDLKAFLSIVRAAMPNHIQNVMSYDLSTRNLRIKNIVMASESSSVDSVQKSLLIYLLMDLDDRTVIDGVKKVLKIDTVFSSSTLFFKIVQMLQMKYNLSNEDSTYLKSAAQKLISKNRSGLKGRMERFNKVLGLS